jgi:hypothetical protein
VGRRLFLLALVFVACTAPIPTLPPPSASLGVSVATAVPNGTVETVVSPTYATGRPVRVIVRLLPSLGTLRGPLAPVVQAGGFHATAIVRHLDVQPLVASTAAGVSVELVWDAASDTGATAPEGDYSLVFDVEDDRGRRSTVGATLVLRG